MAHCDCMAGLGETCTHVGAILHAVNALVKQEQMKTVTDVPAYWVIPNIDKTIEPKPIRDIDFTSAKSKKKKMDLLLSQASPPERKRRKLPTIPESTDEDMKELYSKLNTSNVKSSVLSITPPFSDGFVPKVISKDSKVWLASNLRLDYSEQYSSSEIEAEREKLMNSDIFKVSDDDVQQVEKETRGQTKSKKWFEYRAGRITASNSKKVCATSIEKPALSTVKSICHHSTFSSAATAYGNEHEQSVFI